MRNNYNIIEDIATLRVFLRTYFYPSDRGNSFKDILYKYMELPTNSITGDENNISYIIRLPKNQKLTEDQIRQWISTSLYELLSTNTGYIKSSHSFMVLKPSEKDVLDIINRDCNTTTMLFTSLYIDHNNVVYLNL